MNTQPIDALALANEVRQENARLRRQLASLKPAEARRRAAELLRTPNQAVSASRIGTLLQAVPRIGATQCHTLLLQAGVRDSQRRVRSLTARQREALAYRLEHPRLVLPNSKLWIEPQGCCPRCGQRPDKTGQTPAAEPATSAPAPLDEGDPVVTDVRPGYDGCDVVTVCVPARQGVTVEAFIRRALGGTDSIAHHRRRFAGIPEPDQRGRKESREPTS